MSRRARKAYNTQRNALIRIAELRKTVDLTTKEIHALTGQMDQEQHVQISDWILEQDRALDKILIG